MRWSSLLDLHAAAGPGYALTAFSVLAAYATMLVDVNEQECVDLTAFVET